MAEIGSTLREARMRAHIDISEVEASTKIRAKYLRAIENEEWDLLPGTIYVKSFLRTYGDYLGLDSRLLIDEFKRRYERPADHEVRPLSGVGRERERERSGRRRASASLSLSPRVVIAAAVVVIVVALYVIGSNSGSPPASGGRTAAGGGSGSHIHKGNGKGKGKGKHTGGGRRGGTTTTSRTTTRTSTTVATAKATLQLVATGKVWVCVEGPDRRRLIDGVEYVAGESIPAVSATKLWVALGNGNVTATVNGKRYPITRSANAIGLTITAAAGAKSIASPPTCT